MTTIEDRFAFYANLNLCPDFSKFNLELPKLSLSKIRAKYQGNKPTFIYRSIFRTQEKFPLIFSVFLESFIFSVL